MTQEVKEDVLVYLMLTTLTDAGRKSLQEDPEVLTGGGERPDVHSLNRLSMARDPERPAAEKLGLRLLRSVDI